MGYSLIFSALSLLIGFVFGLVFLKIKHKKTFSFPDIVREMTNNENFGVLNTDKLLQSIIRVIASNDGVRHISLIHLQKPFLYEMLEKREIEDIEVSNFIVRYMNGKEDGSFVFDEQTPVFKLLHKHVRGASGLECRAFYLPVLSAETSYALLIFIEKTKYRQNTKYLFDFSRMHLQLTLFLKNYTRKYRDNFELLDHVFLHGPVAMAMTNKEGVFVQKNKKMNLLFKRTISRLDDLFSQDLIDRLFQGNVIDGELNFENKFIKYQGSPVYQSTGGIKGCFLIFTDESIQYLLYRKLELSEERYRKLIKKLPVGLVILTMDAQIFFINDTFSVSLGISDISLVQGRYLGDFFELSGMDISEIFKNFEGEDSEYYKFQSKKEYGERIYSVNLRQVELGEENYIEAVFQDISLENALYNQLDEKNKLLEEELNTARMVQEHILAIPPIYTPGVRFEEFYKPSYQLGGDFFDIVPVDDTHLGVIMADVSGHGVSASLITAMLKILVEFAPKDPHKLHEMMSYLNIGLLKIIPEDSFITMFYGIVDTVHYTMTYINCGHPFPLLFNEKDNSVEILKGVGFPLGSIKSLSFEELTQKVTLPDDGKMLFYTDGLLNFKKNDRSMNFESLKEIFIESAQMRNRDVLNHIYVNVVRNSKNFSEDDISMLLLIFNKKFGFKNFLSIPSNVLEIDLAIIKIIGAISKRIPLNEEDEWKLYTALYEAMINAVEHGNKFNVQKRVTVIYRVFADNWIVFKIRDEGPGFKPKEIPNPLNNDNLLKPSGRGLFMIKKMMKKVRYNSKGNEITMYMQINGE